MVVAPLAVVVAAGAAVEALETEEMLETARVVTAAADELAAETMEDVAAETEETTEVTGSAEVAPGVVVPAAVVPAAVVPPTPPVRQLLSLDCKTVNAAEGLVRPAASRITSVKEVPAGWLATQVMLFALVAGKVTMAAVSGCPPGWRVTMKGG